MEENLEYTESFDIDDSATVDMKAVEIKPKTEKKTLKKAAPAAANTEEPINILRNERIIVRHVPKQGGMITNPKHVLYGGMGENATRTFVVPRLRSGAYVNVLTDNEKAFLEDALGLEYGALSSMKRVDNFWDDSNEMGISKVTLRKQDNYLDLSNPEDYIRYKILLANKDFIAPSLQALQDSPKATYQFVIISEGEENKQARDNMSTTMKCYKEFGKVEEDSDTLKVIIESITGRPLAANTKLEFLQTKVNELIQSDSKLFYKVITDPLLSFKVLIKRGVEAGAIINRDNHFLLRDGNLPLCGPNEEATLNTAAKYISAPKHQGILFAIQAKLKD